MLLFPSEGLLPSEDLVPRPPRSRPGPVPFDPDSALRAVDFNFDLLGHDEVQTGTLDSVTGGDLAWDATASVHGGGSIEVVDIGQPIDWLKVRIRVAALLSPVGGGDGIIGRPLGIWLPAAPVEKWSEVGRSWSVELTDKTAILDQDIVTNDDGDPIAYAAQPGADVITLVRDLINNTGESTAAIEPGTAQVRSAVVWESGTTRLQIINDLLAAAGYLSLWCDMEGQFRVTEYVAPAQRPLIYRALTPLTRGQMSQMSPDYTLDRDVYAVPNRVLAVGNGSGNEEAWTAVAANTDEDSPFSYPSRGRWITHSETGVEAMTPADLQTRADQTLASLTAVAASLDVEHIYLPDLQMNAAIEFRNPEADQAMRCTVQSTSVPLDPMGMCRSTMTEALT